MTFCPPLAGDIIDHTPLTNKARFRFNFLYRELCPREITPAASSKRRPSPSAREKTRSLQRRYPSLQPRASQHSRASVCDLRGNRRPASTSTVFLRAPLLPS